jgi:hypothetical protein
MAPENSLLYPDCFMRGMVKEPVVTAFAQNCPIRCP